MAAIIQNTPKFVELDLKVRLPENYVRAAQELLDEKVWGDPSLNYALNCILYQGLNAALMGIALPRGEEGKEENDEFLDKHCISDVDQMHTDEIMEMAWRKEAMRQ